MDAEVAALLADYPTVLEIPVWWGDQDSFGHVNNTVPLRWFESARIAYCERIGLWQTIVTERVGPILAAISCNFRRQIRYPETVYAGARITRIGRTSLTMEHLAVSARERLVVVDGVSTLVVLDYTANRPVPVPEPVRAAIAEWERKVLA
jgi:acyl-CoA thioester hydrolase